MEQREKITKLETKETIASLEDDSEILDIKKRIEEINSRIKEKEEEIKKIEEELKSRGAEIRNLSNEEILELEEQSEYPEKYSKDNELLISLNVAQIVKYAAEDDKIRLKKKLNILKRERRYKSIERAKVPKDLQQLESEYERLKDISKSQEVDYRVVLANEFFPRMFKKGTKINYQGHERVVESVGELPLLDGNKEYRVSGKGFQIYFSGIDDYLKFDKGKTRWRKKDKIQVDSPNFKIYQDLAELDKIEHEGYRTARTAPFSDTFGLPIEERIDKIKKVDPETGRPYEFSTPEEKRDKIRKGITFVKETLKRQYQTIADIAKSTYYYLEKYPDASFLELYTKFITEDVQKMLSAGQLVRLEQGLYKAVNRIRVVERYYEEFKNNPRQGLEKIFGVKLSGNKGDFEIFKMNGVLHFNVWNDEDYAVLYAEKSPESTGGFATQQSLIPELRGAITISRAASGNRLEGTKIHEQRHQLNKFFSEDSSFKYGALVFAKNEIIAFLKEGKPPQEIIKWLIEEGGLYDYYKKANISDSQRESYNKRIKELINIASNVHDSYGLVDVDLLAVSPLQHWKWLQDKVDPLKK